MQTQLWKQFNSQLDGVFAVILLIALGVGALRALFAWRGWADMFDRIALSVSGASIIFVYGAKWLQKLLG